MLKLTHLFSTGGAYERSAAALRATDLVEVHRREEQAGVLTHRIPLEERAEKAADDRTIGREFDQPAEAGPEVTGSNEPPRPRQPLGGSAPSGSLGN